MSLWYVRRKLCTYIVSRLALSPNRPSFHLNLVTSDYYQVHPKWFLSRWYVWRKLRTYLALTLTQSPNRKKRDSIWLTSPRGSIGCVQNDFLSLWNFWRKWCTYLASRLALSPNGPSFHLSLITKEYHRVCPNDFWADGTFGTNCTPILHRH
jgi:hypothetical protein